MNIEKTIETFDGTKAAFLEELFTFLRFQTISAQPDHKQDLTACVEWLRNRIESAGLSVDVIETEGHPAILADTGPVEGGGPTVLCYGHYDVQPEGDLSLWESPPFEPMVRDGAIFARGSADDKGQLWTHIAALRSYSLSGRPWPCRVKMLIEGEEEIGSPHLVDVIQQHRERLSCDLILISDTSKRDAETPGVTYATRGMIAKELILDGPAKDLHSGQFGGSVANPANVLAHIVAGLHDADQRVTIPGFYDHVVELTDSEKTMLAEWDLSEAELCAVTGSPASCGEAGYTTGERRTARPTLDVNGLVSGYTGEGSASIVPMRASAKISMRLVADQDPDRISKAFDRAVRQACPAAVRLSIRSHAQCAAYAAPVDSDAMRAAREALAESYGTQAALLREGGTLPILPLFRQVLGADSLMVGFADPACNLHSPNEFFHIRDFERGTESIIRLLTRLAAISG